MKTNNEQIILLKSKIAQAERNKVYADSSQARENQQRGIDDMEVQLKELESKD